MCLLISDYFLAVKFNSEKHIKKTLFDLTFKSKKLN